MRCPMAGVAALVALLASSASASAQAPVQPYGTNDGGGFWNVLPPGANGHANAVELGTFLAACPPGGTTNCPDAPRPKHSSKELGMYGDLVYASPGLQPADIPRFFKDATFGVRDGEAERVYSPRADVTIVRDSAFGVPHVYSQTRIGAMFGLGYAGAEDRLFVMDVLRNAGRGRLSSFAGGSEGNRQMDRDQWRLAPYTEADLQRQYDLGDDIYGPAGARLQRDVTHYVAGINAYIAEARLDPLKMPGEYAAIGRPAGPEDWKVTDVIATASLIGGIFGKGGGRELDSALLLQEAQARFGAEAGGQVWEDLRRAEDPEAPVTVQDATFPYRVEPAALAPDSLAMPDSGSVERTSIVAAGAPGPGGGGGIGGLLRFPEAGSNALLVSARESESGRPLAVMGPQTAYFQPQLLMDVDVHAPGIDARGATFAGIGLYVLLGRGRDYAWSATSAGQDIIDTFAVELCEPGGGTPTKQSMHYRFRGACEPIEVLERRNAWLPSPADQTPPGSETLRAERTKLGLVIARATVDGRPVAYTSLRSTYFHEADSALGFVELNDPNAIRGAEDFKRAVSKIGFTFNWFYADHSQIAYFNSGNNPVRAPETSTHFPVSGDFEWSGWDTDLWTSAYTPPEEHPQVVDQAFLANWNNKQAHGFRAADDNFGYGSTYRSVSLSERISAGIAGAETMSLVELVDAMEDAGTVDLRATEVLPWALRVLEGSPDPQVQEAVATLRAWVAAGGHRVDRDRDGVYEHAEAIRILDAWWPRWLEAQFEPTLGSSLFDSLTAMQAQDNSPNGGGNHHGSAYQGGWYGYAQKDLRSLLGEPVTGPFSRVYCGGSAELGGTLESCRERLTDSLRAALAVDPAALYADQTCEDYGMPSDQWCYDAVRHRPVGAVNQPLIHWINRPTFQQLVEVQAQAPR